MPSSGDDRRARFHELHGSGRILLLPNAWDVGSARLLEAAGFEALATTSAGLAWSLGKPDQGVTRNELLQHVDALAAAVGVPLSVDSERCYADTPAGVAETVRLLADAGAAGCSIEDYDPAAGAVDEVGRAAERVAAAAEETGRTGMVLTARAESHLYGGTDLDDTIARLRAYHEAGADVVYAPGLRDAQQIAALVASVEAPVNVLALAGGPSVAELVTLGVRRVSTGGALASVAYAAMLRAARELQADGTSTYAQTGLTPSERAVFDLPAGG